MRRERWSTLLPRQPTALPGERSLFARHRQVVSWLAAFALPIAVAALMVPWREDLAQSTAIIMIVPVVLVAGTGGLAPGLAAAVVASAAFDFALTRPYYKPTIHENDDVVATIVLLAVGTVVGLFTQQLARHVTRAEARLREMDHLTGFVRETLDSTSEPQLVAATRRRLIGVLGLLECEWQSGERDFDAPVLLADGHVMGKERDLPPDRAQLPDSTRLPVRQAGLEVGSWVLHPAPGRLVSLEERRTAAAIADLMGQALRSLAPS